jgi:virginiamycin B lyase
MQNRYRRLSLLATVLLWAVGGIAGHALAVTFSEFPVPSTSAPTSPESITAGPDGALWFTDSDSIGRVTTDGVITKFSIPTTDSGPDGITSGPDGALWFIEALASKIGRITTVGAITEFPMPTANVSAQGGITAGPDGALWFTESDVGKIGRITTAGLITEFPTATAGSLPGSITKGPDGALWFTETATNSTRSAA